ncbi:hypothetical protein [Cryobacterium sp. N19]|uniref:hypothetical protein n=1 Tax=Cryobacterium sp. N19 TaxID=2048288 RepID=UPI001E30A1A5|nr:hypothetical protein [Cryobacterium sp. N19]
MSGRLACCELAGVALWAMKKLAVTVAVSRHDVHVTTNRNEAYTAVDDLADWSDWASFATAAPVAPLTPGVYQMRTRDGVIVYVGMAGERKGQGIRGRLSIYRLGKGAVSGFGEAALDRALADATFVEEHLDAVHAGQPTRASVWAQDAIRLLDVELRWAECATQGRALALESAAVEILKTHAIWNRIASGVPRSQRPTQAPRSSGLDPEEEFGASGGRTVTVAQLTREFGRDGGTIRRALRAGFPDHAKGKSWDPLTAAQIAHVRVVLSL